MNLHEFQSKKLFAGYGIPVPLGYAVETAREARIAAEDLGGDRWMVKAQAHTGGRGKAGGVVLVTSLEAVEQSGLRGRGGGGFPTGTKWKFAAREKAEIFAIPSR